MVLNDLFTEAKRPVKQGSINDYPVPKKLHKGVDKIYARVLQRQVDRENGEHVPNVDEQVAVIVAAHPKLLSYGIFKRVGRSGKCHIKLLGGKLKDWAAGDMIAVEPSEVYATWDPSLSDKTAVHRAYNDAGQSTVREGYYDSDDFVNNKTTGEYGKGMSYVSDRRSSGFPDSAHLGAPAHDDSDSIRKRMKTDHLPRDPFNRPTPEFNDDEYDRNYKPMRRSIHLIGRPGEDIEEATGLKKHVKIVKGPAAGKTGYVGEVHNGLYKGAPKQFVIDLDGGGNIKCSKDELRLIKDTPIDEARGLAPVSPYVDLLGGLAWFITAQTAKITQDAVDAAAQQELQSMQQQFQKPILNGMTFAQVYDNPTLYKNPKVAPVLLKFVYDMLGYIEPRIKKFIRPELQTKWLNELTKLKDKYRAAVTQVS